MVSGILEVELVDAKGLGDTDFLGQGSKAVWKEKFLFNVEYPGSCEGYKLIFKILDKDTFSNDDYIGQATIYVKDLLALGAEKGAAELHANRYSVVGADQKYCGEIDKFI